MNSNRFYLVRFPEGGPSWEFFDGLTVSECPPPPAGSKATVVALVPDGLLYFYQPKGLTAKGERSQRAAVRLQMQHFLPPAGDGQEIAAFRGPSGKVLGLITRPGLRDFMEEHGDVFRRATLVTSAFLLAWSAAEARGVGAWTWGNGSGPRALFAGGDLHYFTGGDEELAERVQAANLDESPADLSWTDVLAALAQHKTRLGRLALPIGSLGGGAGLDASKARRLALVLGLVGLMFCFGEAARWWGARGELQVWRTALRQEYAKVLSDPNVADPYGKLLFRLDQMQNNAVEGVDVLALLTALSRHAPDGFMVKSLSLGTRNGRIEATAPDYAAVETMVAALAGVGGFTFTLDSASNGSGSGPVDVTLGVAY
ncbi:MAG: hypothetical protein H0S85_03935 [Desulfovibrionaceae bacterium]|jgi:hypothetical protein|nr:hypothetical protein [Desulfovibrionaceae bacterium]